MGNLKSVTSPRQNATTYDYTDSFTSSPSLTTGTKTWAFPTKVTNALSQFKSTIYDYYLGRPILVTCSYSPQLALALYTCTATLEEGYLLQDKEVWNCRCLEL